MGSTRPSHEHWVSGVLIVILLLLISFAPSYGWKVRAWLSPAPGGATGAAASQADAPNLVAENDALKAQLAALQTVAAEMPTSSPAFIRAMVYSRYPMSFHNEILVDEGSNAGVATGAAVVFQGMLIGRVQSVFPSESLVQTIFDNGFRMPVRIGAHGIDGLLQGGAAPMVGSVAATAPVARGEAVYSAASGMPYALPVATVAATSTSPDSLFEQASLDLPYDLNNIQTVLIAQ